MSQVHAKHFGIHGLKIQKIANNLKKMLSLNIH